MFVLSVAFHMAMLALLVNSKFSLSRTSVAQLPSVISVDLVAMPSAARPAPLPPKPVVKKPIVKKVVLPKEAMRDPEKPKPVAKRREPELAPDPKPVVQEKYADVLAQLRAEAGEVAPKPVVTAKTAPQQSSGIGRPVAPEVAAWIRRTKAHIKPNWVLPPGFRTQELQTHVLVNIDRGGVVRGEPKITRSSGNPWYDDGVVRAIMKSSPLPAPPEADRWAFVFVPEDGY